jgi:hypothetical protein
MESRTQFYNLSGEYQGKREHDFLLTITAPRPRNKSVAGSIIPSDSSSFGLALFFYRLPDFPDEVMQKD